GGGGGGGSVPHAELRALAVTHLPDLLQCLSETTLTMPPVTGWIKNINDHAIHGGKQTPPPHRSSPTAMPPSDDTRANANASAANLSFTPLLASLA
ncbi:unnamed protein product, partial [Ectocarpus fasciculatus]